MQNPYHSVKKRHTKYPIRPIKGFLSKAYGWVDFCGGGVDRKDKGREKWEVSYRWSLELIRIVPLLLCGLDSDAVFLDLFTKRFAINSQILGDLGPVSAKLLQHLDDLLFFQFSKGSLFQQIHIGLKIQSVV